MHQLLNNLVQDMKRIFLICLAAYCVCIAANADSSLQRLAVFNPIAKVISSDMAAIIREVMSSVVVNSGQYEVIDRMTLDRVLEEQSFANSGMMDESHAVRAGKIAGAQKVLFPVIVSEGNTKLITIKLLDVETGKVEKQQYQKLDDSSDYVDVAENLTKKLLGLLEPEPEPSYKISGIHVCTRS